MLKVTFYGDVYADQDPRTAMHAHAKCSQSAMKSTDVDQKVSKRQN
jgi:hypothetical protein